MGEDLTNGLPPITTGEQDQEEYLQQFLLDMSLDYPAPHYMLEYKGVGFGSIGDIQAIGGQAKNGKTFLITQLMAAILNVNSERMSAKLPELTVPADTLEYLGHLPKVLYVDTEQSKLFTALVARRTLWLCGLNTHANDERLKVLYLREEDDVEKKMQIIRMAFEAYKPDAVFIDGIRDLVVDFNRLEECQPIIAKLMKISADEETKCCIFNVCHYNPNPSNGDVSKMRGHMGTELTNKATDVLVSTKTKENKGKDNEHIYFTVSQVNARGKDLPEWKYEIEEIDGLAIPRMLDANVIKKEEDKGDNVYDIKQWLWMGKASIEWPASIKDIKSIIETYGGVHNNDKLAQDIKKCINSRFIVEQDKSDWEKGQKKAKYNLNITSEEMDKKHDTTINGLPFTPVNDDESPF